MRKYPPPRYTKSIVDNSGASLILMIITVCCPPLGLIAYLVTGLIEEFFLSMRK